MSDPTTIITTFLDAIETNLIPRLAGPVWTAAHAGGIRAAIDGLAKIREGFGAMAKAHGVGLSLAKSAGTLEDLLRKRAAEPQPMPGQPYQPGCVPLHLIGRAIEPPTRH